MAAVDLESDRKFLYRGVGKRRCVQRGAFSYPAKCVSAQTMSQSLDSVPSVPLEFWWRLPRKHWIWNVLISYLHKPWTFHTWHRMRSKQMQKFKTGSLKRKNARNHGKVLWIQVKANWAVELSLDKIVRPRALAISRMAVQMRSAHHSYF